jgi:3-oxoadipate enol-lactonase
MSRVNQAWTCASPVNQRPSREAVAPLLETIVELRHLLRNLPTPIRLCLFADGTSMRLAALSAAVEATRRFLLAACASFGVLDLDFLDDSSDCLSSFELLISRRLSKCFHDSSEGIAGDITHGGIDTLIRDFDPDANDRHVIAHEVPVDAGLRLSAFASSQRDRPAVILLLPCGLPFDLCRKWFGFLSQRFFVVTWETRGLFGHCPDFDRAQIDPDTQADDMVAVLDSCGIERAHLMGICGGAVIALCAAARFPLRVRSLGLWYGDYNLSDPALRTRHQQNFEWLMEAAAEGREAASDLHESFADQATLPAIPERIAHLALVPYSNPESMYRYARVNDALCKKVVLPLLPQVLAPSLVVTGDCDETTHKDGSAFVAGRIAGSRLHVEVGGDHQTLFNLPQGLQDLATCFIEAHS